MNVAVALSPTLGPWMSKKVGSPAASRWQSRTISRSAPFIFYPAKRRFAGTVCVELHARLIHGCQCRREFLLQIGDVLRAIGHVAIARHGLFLHRVGVPIHHITADPEVPTSH